MATKKKWIQGSVKPANKGKLRRALKAKKGKPIPKSRLRAAAKKKGKLGKEARWAINVGKSRKGRKR